MAAVPAQLRRELDGRSVYTRPGTARYATAGQLEMEDKLVQQAQQQGPRTCGARPLRGCSARIRPR